MYVRTRGLCLSSGDVGHFKRTVRAANICGFLGRGDKLLPLPAVVYATGKLEVSCTNRWRARLSGLFFLEPV